MSTLDMTPYNPAHSRNISAKGKLHGRTYTYADIHAGHKREREIPMQGFDAHYGNIPDYIIRCTYDIWEHKNTGLIATHYADVGEIYTPLGFASHMQGVIESTNASLAAFHTDEGYCMNVIWGGNEKDGYLSSHLVRASLVHTGDTDFAPASNNPINTYTIADCLCHENKIIKEWLVRDNGGAVKQMGQDVKSVAWKLAVTDYKNSVKHWWENDCEKRINAPKIRPELRGRPDDNSPIQVVRNMFNDVWRANYFALVDEYYSYNVLVKSFGSRDIVGTPNLKTLLTDIYGALAGADFVIDHIQSTPSNAGGNETFVHVRWSITATHRQSPLFGAGTGYPLYIMGISQFRVVDGRICEEWTLLDELAIWKQIHLHTIRNNPDMLTADTQ